MIIRPDTNLRLLSNVPLDNTYTHTMYFNSKAEQAAYFTSHQWMAFENFSYQRQDPSRGFISEIRVPIVADEVYNCNYLMFQNKNFSGKWFYGFIKKIKYINDNVTGIEFEIDVLQTWAFDYVVHPSFVVREHVNNDTKYSNLIEESLEFGEHYVAHHDDVTNMKPEKCWIVISASFPPLEIDGGLGAVSIASKTLGWMYNAIYYYAFDDADKAEAFINKAVEAAVSQGILNVFMFPKPFWPLQQENPAGDEKADPGISAVKPEPTIQTISDKCPQSQTFGGYKPHNNKLYNYPYNYCLVSNCQGGFATFKYEYFTGENPSNPVFAVSASLSNAPDFVFWPMDYKGIHSNWNECIGLGSYPMCSWTTDSYRAYLAQNAASLQFEKTNIAIDAGQGVVNGIMSALVSGVTGNIPGAISGVMGATNSLVDAEQDVLKYQAVMHDRSLVPPQANTHNGNETGFALNLRNFHIYNMVIRREFAEKIDKYWDMFGYQVNTVKVPNRTGRKSWNYVKCANVQITGNMPVDDLALICKIYETGITFWHVDDVGNYTLDNPIIGGVT